MQSKTLQVRDNKTRKQLLHCPTRHTMQHKYIWMMLNDKILTLTSRWMWPWWWRYSKPFKISRNMVAITTSSKPSGYAAFKIWRQEPPDMNGMTTHRLWSLTKEQWDLRTLGWSTRIIVCASREMLFCRKKSYTTKM